MASKLYGILRRLAFQTRYNERGSVASATIAAGSVRTVEIQFQVAFPSAPYVIVGLASSSTASGVGKISAAASNITATGFTLRIFNGDTDNRAPGAFWYAAGPRNS